MSCPPIVKGSGAHDEDVAVLAKLELLLAPAWPTLRRRLVILIEVCVNADRA